MLDVLIAGAGPAGSIAALVLARAGMRVLVVDRAVFPRDKLCGDTVNPGALALLAGLGLRDGPLTHAQPVTGMRLTGPWADVRALYGDGVVGRVLPRRELDQWLLDEAIRAGARFENALVVRAPLLDESTGRRRVRGLVLAPRGRPDATSRMPATLVLAADGSRSCLARSLGLMRAPQRPRRWAFGAYANGIHDVSDVGEMHVRPAAYVGIAPINPTTANVCVVTGPRPTGRRPIDIMMRAIEAAALAPRFQDCRFLTPPMVLGPLASDVTMPGAEGLLLAGDASGFVDPMTGDGLYLAMRGAVLAAEEAVRSMNSSDLAGAPARLAEARRDALGSKLRFDRIVRRISSTPAALAAASCGAVLAPSVLARAVRYAGDVPDAGARRSALGTRV